MSDTKDNKIQLCPVCGFPIEKYSKTGSVTIRVDDPPPRYFDQRYYYSYIDWVIGAPPIRRYQDKVEYYTIDIEQCPRCQSKDGTNRHKDDVSPDPWFINKNQYLFENNEYYCKTCGKKASHSAVKFIFKDKKFAFTDVLYCPDCEDRPNPISYVKD